MEILLVLDPAHGTATEEVDTDCSHGGGGVNLRQQDHDKDAELSRRFRQRCEIIGEALEYLHSGQIEKLKKIEWLLPPLSTVCKFVLECSMLFLCKVGPVPARFFFLRCLGCISSSKLTMNFVLIHSTLEHM